MTEGYSYVLKEVECVASVATKAGFFGERSGIILKTPP
jgi:hypothetical protein